MTSKLVRDKIPEIIRQDGRNPVCHFADEAEYAEALIEKLKEEAKEFLDNPCVEEAADVMEVIYAICKNKNIDISNLEEVRLQKVAERGAFEQGIILEKID
jgi:predicted house-cleaning noncanonical NTP pyrophosphatase (MazG superfamily)